jgi:predicted TIM-barrel fold metal-dependent hydrolase
MTDARLISADSHVNEPQDLWSRRVAAAFRDRAPRIERRDGMGDWFVADGILPFPVALGMAAPKAVEERTMLGTYDEGPAGGWDPDARIADQDADGVEAEVIYPTHGLLLFGLQDGAYQHACFAAYNEWLAEFTRAHPERLAGIGLISVEDVPAAVREVERIARLGLRGIMIPGDNPDPHYGDPRYDPLWAACQAHDLPISLHTLTGRRRVEAPDGLGLARYVGLIHNVQFTLATFILHRVLERFPGLKLVSAENDIGWIPHYVMRLDYAYNKHRHWCGQDELALLPSEYFRRQVWATFMDDRPGIHAREFYSVDRMMWASDYPHSDSTWPRSREIVERNLEGTTAEEKRKITRANASRLYGLG